MPFILDYLRARALEERYLAGEPFGVYYGVFRGFAAEAHAHDHMQLLVPLKGRMHLVAGPENHLLGPEWAAVVPPGMPHAFTHVDGELEFVSIDGPWEALLDLAGELATPLSGTTVVREPHVWMQAKQLAAETVAQAPGWPRMLHAGVEQGLVHFLRAAARPPAEPMAKEPRVLRAIERMLREYTEDLSVPDLADEVAMSPRHFERCFKEALGQSPKQFLIEVRIGAARELLGTTELSVVEVALRTGFKNPSHFTQTFQRVVGCTPSAFRSGLFKS